MKYEIRNKPSYIPKRKISQWREVQVDERSHNRLKDKEVIPVEIQSQKKKKKH